MKIFLFKFLVCMLIVSSLNAQTPLRIAVIGTTHGHVGWILGKKQNNNVQIAGIFETNKELVQQEIRQYHLPEKLFYTDLNKMLDEVKPEAAVVFGSIYQHLAAVEACAPRGIHVMVEKPLAVSAEHAQRMDSLAKKHKIYLLTNYETSWYPTTTRVHTLAVDSNYAGKIRKAVFHHGHEGPKEIGVSKEFFEWLTDPVQNGGGALVDFGCYGANIMTWLMGNQQPLSVTAVTRQFKPAIYPKVDDEATIIVEYPTAQSIIQASWNWPFGRKDMEVYGETGYLITSDANNMRRKNKASATEVNEKISKEQENVYDDPFKYFADVIRGKISVGPYSPYSLENNLLVVKILSAARLSAQTGRKVVF